MKFFTMRWWLECQNPPPVLGTPQTMPKTEAIDFPNQAYLQHLAVIRERFPADVLDINEQSVLHDGLLHEIRFDQASNSLTLAATVDDGSGWDRDVEFCYQEVVSFRIVPWEGKPLPPRAGLGEMGYDELDVAPDGALVHRILFNSGIEFDVQFRNIELR
ncbi:MAG: hypothetical protein HY290_00790 [Planctomycetia bacterium]|nr:hypothetical protein [Planctomycetia bacterium]